MTFQIDQSLARCSLGIATGADLRSRVHQECEQTDQEQQACRGCRLHHRDRMIAKNKEYRVHETNIERFCCKHSRAAGNRLFSERLVRIADIPDGEIAGDVKGVHG